MSLKSIFSEQIDDLRSFLDDPSQTIRAIRYEPDVEPLIEKVLVKLDDDDDNPHVMIVCQTPCQSVDQYFQQLLTELDQQNEIHREGMETAGLNLPRLDDQPRGLPPDEAFQKYVNAIADCLPPWSGAYVLVLYPDDVTDEAGFKLALHTMEQNTHSELVKYIALDRQTNPILDDIADWSDRAGFQVFEFSPGEIENRIHKDLESPSLSPKERLQYLAMVGSFAMAKQKYEDAEVAQLQAIEMAQQQEASAELAANHYNFGNTLLAQGKANEAEEHYSQAIEIGVQEEMHALVGMALTNLGVAVQHRGDIDQSMECFEIAQRTFKAVNNPPGEAHALDNKAQVLHREDCIEAAEQAWLEALALYDGITAETFSKLRESGREDILGKLREFYKATDQPDKTLQLSH